MKKTTVLFLLLAAFSSNSSYANVVGADTQNFNPLTSGLDFITVHSSETLKPGILNLGLFLNYAVNTLPNYEDATTQSRTNFSDSLLSSDLNFGLGLMRNWDIGFSFPVLLYQNVDSDAPAFRGQYEQTGLTEIRGNTKYRFYGDDRGGLAAILSFNLNQIEDNPFAGTDPGPTYNLELAADTVVKELWTVGGNLGYRFRDSGKAIAGVPVIPFGDQWIGSMAVSYLLTQWDIKVVSELFGSYPVESHKFASDRELSSLEMLLGAKADLTPDLAFHVGAGTELIHGTASPDWRVYTGINWAVGPLFSKSDQAIVRVEEPVGQNIDEDYDEDPFEVRAIPLKKETFRGKDILFEFNSDVIHPDAMNSMKGFVEYLQKSGFVKLVIEGHTDSIGSESYNQSLSERRAARVRQTLVSLGLPSQKVTSIGYGETLPIADNGNFQGRAINRRVEFQVER